MLRHKVPSLANMSDDYIRNVMIQSRNNAAKEKANLAQHQQSMSAQMQRAQALGPDVNAQGAAPVPNPQVQRPSQQQPQPQTATKAQGKPAAQAQGQKRPQPSSDDIVEIPNPNMASMAISQNAPTQAGPLQQPQGMRMPTAEQLNKMTDKQRQQVTARMRQMEAAQKAQASAAARQAQQTSQSQAQQAGANQVQQPAMNPKANRSAVEMAARAKIQDMRREIAQANPKGPDSGLDAKGKEQVQASLKKLWTPIVTLFQSLPSAMHAFGEGRVREALKIINTIEQNAMDGTGAIKGYLSVTPIDMRKMEQFVAQYFTDMKTLRERRQGLQNGDAQAQAQGQPQPATQQPRPQQSSKAQQPQRPSIGGRKASASTKVPAAPTENKTFDWGSPSPHGVPKYDAQSQLTADKLKIPAQKKRKTSPEGKESKAGVAAAMSPQPDVKVPSKAQTGKAPVQTQQPPQPVPPPVEPAKFKCDDQFCDASITGFETEQELKQHWEAEHKPVDDPLQFMLKSVAKFCNVDLEGKPLPTKKGIKAELNGVAKATAKQSSATKPNAKAIDDKSAVLTSKPAREKTLREALAEKHGIKMPALAVKDPTSPEDSDTKDDEFLVTIREGLADVFPDDPVFNRNIINWNSIVPRPEPLSSPDLTPSEQASSEASRESDISQTERLRINMEWDPFGNGDTFVPEILRLKKLELGAAKAAAGDDIVMGNADSGKEAEKKIEEKDDPLNWDSDLDWDAWFAGGDDNEFPNATKVL